MNLENLDYVTPPPGYVFVSNHSAFDPETKVNWNEKEIVKKMSNHLGIPVDAFLVLKNVAKWSPYTSFVEDKYSEAIKSWLDFINNEVLEIMERIARGEL